MDFKDWGGTMLRITIWQLSTFGRSIFLAFRCCDDNVPCGVFSRYIQNYAIIADAKSIMSAVTLVTFYGT